MSDIDRVKPPSAEEVARRLRGPVVLAAGPIILAGVGLLGVVRRFKWTAVGAEALLGIGGPVIFASNHSSHADTAAILGTLPASIRRRTCVAAALDVFGAASNGDGRRFHALRRECLQIFMAAGFHGFAFDRHGPPLRSLRTAVDLVRDGWSLLLYPEGTRSRTGGMGPFKPGVGLLARSTGRPVLPVHVSGGGTILPCGQWLPQRGHAIVRYGPPVRHVSGESVPTFTARLREQVASLAPDPEVEPDPALDADSALAIGRGNTRKQSA